MIDVNWQKGELKVHQLADSWVLFAKNFSEMDRVCLEMARKVVLEQLRPSQPKKNYSTPVFTESFRTSVLKDQDLHIVQRSFKTAFVHVDALSTTFGVKSLNSRSPKSCIPNIFLRHV